MIDIPGILGAEADSLLGHVCKTIPKSALHLPGPDVVDKVYALSDRPVPVLRSLQQLIEGERITQVVDGPRRIDLVVRLFPANLPMWMPWEFSWPIY